METEFGAMILSKVTVKTPILCKIYTYKCKKCKINDDFKEKL